MLDTPRFDVGSPPLKCPNPKCIDRVGFELLGSETQSRPDGTHTHRVARWKCRYCGCEISFFHKIE
jgi:hypothetical protein